MIDGSVKWFLVVLGVIVLGAIFWPAPPASEGAFPVIVVGPDGEIFNGTVNAKGTADRVLLAAADAGGFAVQATGRADSFFVTSIDGHDNQADGGWCFEAMESGWVFPQVGAGGYRLDDGQATRWSYHPGGCPGA